MDNGPVEDCECEESGHFRPYLGRAGEIDAAVVGALWSLRGQLIRLMDLGLTEAAARHVFRHAVLDLWDLRRLRKLSRGRMWSKAAMENGREVKIVLDHAIPAKRFCDIVLALGTDETKAATPKSKDELANLLVVLSVCCVITKAEHDRLDALGLKSACVQGEETNPYARYKAAGIEMLEPPYRMAS